MQLVSSIKPSRPLMNYYGGKWKLAPWIISHFPSHRAYVELFGGGAAVLLQKPPARREVYNDLDGEIVNLFRVLRDRLLSHELVQLVDLTPHARDEYLHSRSVEDTSLERARRLLIYGSMNWAPITSLKEKTSYRAGLTQDLVGTWARFPAEVSRAARRLKEVLVENRDFERLVSRYDAPDTLFYADPPYVSDTRTSQTKYSHELDTTGQERLASVLRASKGMVVLSGYNCPLYERLYAGWAQFDTELRTVTHGLRTESIWLNQAAALSLQ